jgi:hypothetical protein
MTNRATEKVTLHFDLSHCPADKEFSIGALGLKHNLARHTPESLSRHRATNKALALLSEEHQTRLTHYAEDVELPSEVGMHLVTYANEDPNKLPHLAAVFLHVPKAAKRTHFRQKRKVGRDSHVSLLSHFGLTLGALSPAEAAAVKLDATDFVNPFSTAEAIIFNHPDLLTVKAEVAASVIYDHITQILRQDGTLPQYLSEHGPGSNEPFYVDEIAINPSTGLPIHPITTADGKPIVDKDGKPIDWWQQDGKPVIRQYKLSPEVVGSTDGKTQGKAFSALAAVLRSTKNDLSLNGQSWSVQQGITSTQRSNVQPHTPASLNAADLGAGFQWNLSNKTSTYGLDIDGGSLRYDDKTSKLSFNVKNWANRALSAYVQFFDLKGDPIKDPWKDGKGDQSKMFVVNLSSGNTLAGIPIWTDYTDISFLMPAEATKANVLLGGLGRGVDTWDYDVDIGGLMTTVVFNYVVPSALVALSVGITGFRFIARTLEDMDVTIAIALSKAFLGAPAVILTAVKNPKGLLSMFGGIAMGVIFSVGLEKLAFRLTGFVTTTEILEKAPVIGWAFQIASCAAGIADMIATTVEVLQSPFTYKIEAARIINVQVDVSPDPTHGTKTQKPIWPTQADHWEVVVQYKGGSSVKQTGPMDKIKPDIPLSVLFSGELAISAAPGAQIQITANFYSANDWLCGKWSSAWMAAVAPDGSLTLNVQGSIIESLVPLSAQTQYNHYQKLAFENGHHVWKRTTTPPAGVFSGSIDCPNSGHVMCRLVNITINDLAYALGYTYQASGQNLPLDFGTDPQNGQMYAFQSISVLGDPEAGMKQPKVGFSLQPYISYDQFGPAPLFELPAATYMEALDAANGKPVPPAVATAFANANPKPDPDHTNGSGNFTLPDGSIVTVVTHSAEWYIGLPNKPLYNLRRATDTIKVFDYPTPAFSPRNYYLDSRSFAKEQKYYLRQVVLDDKSSTFDYSSGKSWGAFAETLLDAIVVHPNGYVIGVNYEFHKMLILQLPSTAMNDADAPVALPMSGKGLREGLLQGPVGLAVTPDGRILVLEQDNARIQAFDTMANPVQCFAGPLAFKVNAQFKTELNSGKFSTAFQQVYQQHVQPQLAPSFSLPTTFTDTLNAGNITPDFKQQFVNNNSALSDQGPHQVLTTTPDSVWVLLDQGSGISYDIRKNLYVSVDGDQLLSLQASFISDLNKSIASAALVQEFHDYGIPLSPPDKLQVLVETENSKWVLVDGEVVYEIKVQSNAFAYRGSTVLFNLPAGLLRDVKSGNPPSKDIVQQFTAHDIKLSHQLRINIITPGMAWQLVDQGNNVTYDIHMEADVDVFHLPTFNVEVIAPNTHWLLRDSVNALTFDVKPNTKDSSLLDVQQLVSVLSLKDGVSPDIHYLDVGVESKGFIYVLSYQGTGSAQTDYHLDIYNPDGTWLSRTPEKQGNPGVNGARMIVDQWRNLYTLNYDAILGPNNRTEPSVSTWIPSPPKGED